MEPEVKAFLVRIVQSLSIVLLWMVTNMVLGIFFHFGFIQSSLSLGNILYYIFMLSSLAALIWYLLKLWKQNLQA